MSRYDIGPDTEVREDDWEEEYAIQSMRDDLNSCDALRIIDGVETVDEDVDLVE